MKNKPYLLLMFTLLGLTACRKDPLQGPAAKQSISMRDTAQNLVHIISGAPNFNRKFPGLTSVGMSQFQNGGYLVAGYTDPNNPSSHQCPGSTDIELIKIDVNGNKLWEKIIGGSGPDQPTAIVSTFDSGYIITGFTWSRDGNFQTFASEQNGAINFFMKLDHQGNIKWIKTFPNIEFSTFINVVIETRDHHYLAVGEVDAEEVDSDGNELWHTVVNPGNPGAINQLQSVIQNKNGDFIASGTSNSEGWLVKLSEKGSFLWEKHYGNNGGFDLYGVAEDENGNYLLAGVNRPNPLGNTHGWVLKVDPDGIVLWSKQYGGSSVDDLKAITALDGSHFLLAGNSNSIDGDFACLGLTNYHNKAWLLKINDNGNSRQVKAFYAGTSIYAEIYWLVRGINHTYILGGDAIEPSDNSSRIWVVSNTVQ